MRSTDFTPASSYWAAAFTDSSAGTHLRANDLVSAVEVSGTGYARVEVRGATGINWAIASAGSTNQDSDIVFPTAGGSWGTLYAIALVDAASSGNVILYSDITPRAVTAPDVLRIPVNQFIVNA